MLNILKSPKKLIAEIHNEFDTAQDRLLAQAKNILHGNNFDPIKADRLKKAGFHRSDEVVGNESARISTKLAMLIEYYKQNYPLQKFITEDELERICKKYSLVFAPVGHYLKSVPEKNLSEIENAKPLLREDEMSSYVIFKCTCAQGLSAIEQLQIRRGMRIPKSRYASQCNNHNLSVIFGRPVTAEYQTLHFKAEEVDTSGLFIAAPPNHFDNSGLTKKALGFFRTIALPEDPIVFRYVRGGVQIITKWGLEASDPAVVNEIEN